MALGGIPVARTKLARTKLVHTFMEYLLLTHLPCTDYLIPQWQVQFFFFFAMKWEENDNTSNGVDLYPCLGGGGMLGAKIF